MLKRLLRSAWFPNLVGTMFARWFGFVRWSCRTVVEPADAFAAVEALGPIVGTIWHGEHFMLPFLKPRPDWPVKAMISRSRDGALNVAIVEKFGIGAIRASGGRTGAEVGRRGGVAGVVAAVRELEAGVSVVMTADVPKGPSRVAGEGVVQIARLAGVPIVPVACTTTHCLRMRRSWDRAAVALPFGRFAVVMGEPIRVAQDADAEALEAARLRVERELDRVTRRAYELAGGRA